MSTVEPETVEGTREDAQRYRALFDGSMDAIYLSRDDGKVLRANPAFIALFGYSMEELRETSAETLYVNPEDRARFRAEIEEAGAVHDFETQLRHKDGSNRLCLITASARPTARGSIEYQGIIRDVTDRRREQAELARTAAALGRSNAELEQFAYVASHDLQEPLRKIRAFGDRLSGMAAGRLDERGADYLRRMISAAERMQTLIENLLLYSRVSSRGAEFERVDLNTLVAEVVSDLEPRVIASKARVQIGPLPQLVADALQMRQLFQNLISNALKYGPPEGGGLVQVRAQLLDRGGRPAVPERPWEAVTARIEVEDDGIGFEPEYAEQIFELFQRLHGREAYDGTGIGLGVCRRIVLRHAGAIEAEGRPGEGATFTITLPLTQESDAS